MPNPREAIRRIEAAGWRLTRVKGDHPHFKHTERPGLVTVIHPARDCTRAGVIADRVEQVFADGE